jgi:hypothetical protein
LSAATVFGRAVPVTTKFFIIAGPPGAGKSTLTQQCIVRKLPLFCECSAAFHEFVPAESLEAQERRVVELTDEKKLTALPVAAKALLHKAAKAMPPVLLVHINTFGFQYRDDLIRLSNHYDETIIATIMIEQDDAAERYALRSKQRKRHESRSLKGYIDRKARHLLKFINKRVLRRRKAVPRIISNRALYEADNQSEYRKLHDGWDRLAAEIATHNFLVRFSDDQKTLTVSRKSKDGETECARFGVVPEFVAPL